MIREIDGQIWFCCPECGKKLHTVAPGARGVFVWCRGRRADGSRCTWRGEIRCPERPEDIAAENALELTLRGDVTAPPPRGLVPN